MITPAPRGQNRLKAVLAALFLFAAAPALAAGEPPLGEKIYGQVCFGCHQIGVLGAPKKGDRAAWQIRLKKGLDRLIQNAMNGFGKMPAKGGSPGLGEHDLRAAIRFMAAGALAGAAPAPSPSGGPPKAQTAGGGSARGAQVVQRVCKGCHGIGILGAPKIGNAKHWGVRLKKGEDTLVQNALKGVGNMPPKGGDPALTADDLRAAIRSMITPPQATAKKAPPRAAPPAPAPQKVAAPSPLNANRFNRLMRPKADRNPSPMKDGIHDPQNEGSALLQPPKQAFGSLPQGKSGNYVDWVKALKDGAITPRWDLADPAKGPMVMDLNIVREVKGSMPDVVYPHRAHLEWLECSNCHPAIFQPKKGANQLSMAEILLGRKCGVCHGKVAFPVSECRRCHSKKKSQLVTQ